MMASDHYSVANALRSYVGPDTPGDLAEFLFREGDRARELADALAVKDAEIADQAGDLDRLEEQYVKLAERCSTLKARVAELEAALVWYGENARLCRLIHREGDIGRNALNDDGGKRARAALQGPAPAEATP